MKKKRILIIGESCRDIFIYCNTLRLAPDIPVPVLERVDRTTNPGMAKNVERNIKAIYPHCNIVTNANWRSIIKTRYMDNRTNHGFFRVDVDHRAIGRINIRTIPLKKYDIIGIADYNKGFLSKEYMRAICEKHPCVFVDTKKSIGPFLDKARYIKVNEYEYKRSLPLSQRLSDKIIHTKGSHGSEFRGRIYPVNEVEVKDASGAGDSFFAALLVRYAETGDVVEAIRFANICAGQVVKHRGVSVIHRPLEGRAGKA